MTRRNTRARVSTQPPAGAGKDDEIDRRLTALLVSMWKLELKLVSLQDQFAKLRKGAHQP